MKRLLLLAAGVLVVAMVQAQPRLASPQPGETVHSNSGHLAVVVSGAPAGVRFRAVLDGVPTGETSDNAAITLDGIDRGTHRVAVQWLDRAGRELGRTPEVEFHLWRASRLMPAQR